MVVSSLAGKQLPAALDDLKPGQLHWKRCELAQINPLYAWSSDAPGVHNRFIVSPQTDQSLSLCAAATPPGLDFISYLMNTAERAGGDNTDL